MKKILIIILSTFFLSQSVLAADQTIDMLNKLGKEHMVYSKKIVKIETANFFFNRVLPRIDSHYKSAISGSGYIMNFKFN